MSPTDYPGTADHKVIYNLQKQNYDPQGKLKQLKYFQSVVELPEYTMEGGVEEWDEVHRRICAVLPPRYLAGRPYPALTPLHGESVCAAEYDSSFGMPRGRTAWVIIYHELIEPEFFAELQDNVLQHHPLWRIVLLTTDLYMQSSHDVEDTCNIIVYPDAVVFGNASDGQEFEARFADWQQVARRLTHQFASRDVRRLEWVKSRLSENRPRLVDNDVVPVGVIQSGDECSLWYLTYELDEFICFVTDRTSLSNDEMSGITPNANYPVDSEGRVGIGCGSNPSRIELREDCFSSKLLGDLVVQRFIRRAETPTSDRQWPLELPPEMIVQQEDLDRAANG